MQTRRAVGPLPLMVDDHGGGGPDVLLLHGEGRDASDLETIAGLMVGDGLRVVAVDLRGHGESGTAPWSWEAALADVQAVIDEVGLHDPVLVGHSLGGMVAALWAAEHPECPLAVNIGGHGNPARVDRLAGLTGEAAEEAMESFAYQLQLLGLGLPPWRLDLLRQIADLDLPAVFRTTRCPLLVVTGTETRTFGELLDSPGDAAWTAGWDWLMAALDRTAEEIDLFEHVILDAGPSPHRDDPIGVFRLVTARLVRPVG